MFRVVSINWSKERSDKYLKYWPQHCPGCLNFESERYNKSINRSPNGKGQMRAPGEKQYGVGCICGKTSEVGVALNKEKENDKIPECMICGKCGEHYPVDTTNKRVQVCCNSCDSMERLSPKYKKEGA